MIVSAMTGEKGSLKQAQYRQAWGKDATTLEEYDYYLRGHEELMKFTKEGIERSGEIWREGLAKFPSSPLLEVKLGWHHMLRAATSSVMIHPPMFEKQASSLDRFLPMSISLRRWRGLPTAYEFCACSGERLDGALAAANRLSLWRPMTCFDNRQTNTGACSTSVCSAPIP